MKEKLTLYDNTLSPYKTNENGDKLISGLAVHEGTYHDIIKVSADEISNATNSIVNATLLKDHNGICDNAVGKVTFAKNFFDEEAGRMATYYEGFVDSDESDLIRKIDKGIIDACSIGFKYDPVCDLCGKPLGECEHWLWDDNFAIRATNIDVFELSLTPIPADRKASVSGFSEELFSESLVDLKKKTGAKNMKNLPETTELNIDYTNKISELNALQTDINNGVKFANAEASHKEEIKALEAKFAEEKKALKEEYDNAISDKVGEVLNAKQDLEALQTKYDELSASHKELEEKLNEIKEAELSELRKEVSELSEKVGADLTEEEIAEFSEGTLSKYIEMFSKIAEKNNPTILDNKEVKDTKTYTQDEFEEASPLEKLAMRTLY